MKKLLLIMMLFLSSCQKEAQSVEVTSNDIKIELLFEKDGCKVYRFRDAGHTVYYSDCQGKMDYSYKSGKYSHTNLQSITAR